MVKIKKFVNKKMVMFLFGLTPKELSTCAKDNKVALLQAGASAGNVPNNVEQLARFLASLNLHQSEIIYKWIKKNIDIEGLLPVGDAIKFLTDRSSNYPQNEEIQNCWRSLLVNLSNNKNSEQIKVFIQKPANAGDEISIKTNSISIKSVEVSEKIKTDTAFINENPEVSSSNFLQLILDVLGGISTSNNEKFEISMSKLLDCGVSNDSPLVETLRKINLQRKSPLIVSDIEKGLFKKNLKKFDDQHIDITGEIKVIGACTTITAGKKSYFFDIKAIYVDEEPLQISFKQAQQLFPFSGNAIAFPDTVSGLPIMESSLWTFTICQKNQEKSTQFVVTKFQNQCAKVILIPHSSTDVDAIRNHILDTGFRQYDNPVFCLNDGVIIRPVGHVVDSKNIDFDVDFRVFINRESLIIDGSEYIVDALLRTEDLFDCSPPETVIKRIFKAKNEQIGFESIHKSHINKLSDYVANEKNSQHYVKAIARLMPVIEDVFSSKEIVENVVHEIINYPSIQNELELEKNKILENYTTLLANYQVRIEDIKNKIEQEKVKLKSIEGENKLAATQLANIVTKAFEKARDDGYSVLAQSALLKHFINAPTFFNVQNHDMEADTPSEKKSLTISTEGDAVVNVTGIEKALFQWSAYTGSSVDFLKAAVLTLVGRGVVGLIGGKEQHFINCATDVLAGGIQCSVSITGTVFGLGDLLNLPISTSITECLGMRLGDFLAILQECQCPCVLVIKGANRVPPETYYQELAQAVLLASPTNQLVWERPDKMSIGSIVIEHPLYICLELIGGKSTYPISSTISRELALIPTDSSWIHAEEPLSEISLKFKYFPLELVEKIRNQFSFDSYQMLVVTESEEFISCQNLLLEYGFEKDQASSFAKLFYQSGRLSVERFVESLSKSNAFEYQFFKELSSSDLIKQACSIFDLDRK